MFTIMENINFSLNEINQNIPDSVVLLTYENNMMSYVIYDDIEQLKIDYNTNYTIKSLSQILTYYKISHKKLVKEEMIQVLLFYEIDTVNQLTVERRLRLWANIKELKADSYFSKFITF